MRREGEESPGQEKGRGETVTLDAELLKILACPKCKVRVELEGERLVCVGCGLRYRVEDGIPIMLIDEAEPPAAGWKPEKE